MTSTRKNVLAASSLFALAPATARAHHKQCFAATAIECGSVLEGMHNPISAIWGFSDEIAHPMKESHASVHAAMLQAIVPAAVVVPAGVMALNACQEAHFADAAAV